ncbi:MAG: oxygen-independent coproporphyrinogen oxidase [Acidobacteriaceae bacterium]|nr:oxygen-independent coproporphyrinogen oxidase [Acidobacteriaceae bacterium]
MATPLGIYISVPFCKAKCTFCNFASGAFAPRRMDRYIDRLCQEIAAIPITAQNLGAVLPNKIEVDTLYFGGGTPSLLSPSHLRQFFTTLREQFAISPTAEITLECAPGQLSDATLAELLSQGLNRVSLGVQSFVDRESAAIGRLHTRAMCLDEITRLRAAGIENLSLDLIVGLPHQTEQSWLESFDMAIASGVPHISLYMLEVDEDSRLGREMLAAGTRYSAATVPSEDDAADWYQLACKRLSAAGIHQYEISNFARAGHRSRHNIKYWHRDPYLGFGLDAHSMLATSTGAMRFCNTSDLDLYSADSDSEAHLATASLPLYKEPAPPISPALPTPDADLITEPEAFEESLFLGLRLNEGVSLASLRDHFGKTLVEQALPAIEELCDAGLLRHTADRIALTDHGRLVSNEVFSRLLIATPA